MSSWSTLRDPKGTTKILASYNDVSGIFSVFNDGHGVPIQFNRKENMFIPELVFGEMLTGSNFSKMDETTGGRHGLGAKVCNIFSTWFKVETQDGKNVFEMEWTGNMKVKHAARVRPITPEEAKTGQFTRIQFKPDWLRFEPGKLDDGSLGLMKTRVLETAALHPNLNVSWNEKRIALDFQSYCKLFLPEDEPMVHSHVKKNWEIAVASHPGVENEVLQSSFVNSVSTIRGGTHVDFIADAVAEAARDACNDKLGKVFFHFSSLFVSLTQIGFFGATFYRRLKRCQ